jgi:hypothetical protein
MEVLVQLSSESFERLVSLLAAEGVIFEAGAFSECLVAEVPELSEGGRALVSTLVTLDRLREERGETAEELADALSRSDGMPGGNDERAIIAERLARLLGIESLRLSAKAVDLLYSTERTYLSSRIVTELRPVFHNDPSEEPAAMVLAHRLELKCLSGGTGADEIQIGLDNEDLANLLRVVQRAEEKARTLTSFMEAKDVTVIQKPGGDVGT